VDSSLFVLAILALNVALCEWLCRRTWLRHLGTALLVIVVTAVEANLGLIPTYGPEIPPYAERVYTATFKYVVALAVFWLLLEVNLRRVLRAGLPMLILFLVGSFGIALGVVLGMQVVDGAEAFGDFHGPLAGMFVGTYTGGSINFAALASHYGVREHATLFAGANAVDAAMTAVWMAVCVGLPRLLAPAWPARDRGRREESAALEAPDEEERVHPFDLGVTLGLGLLALWLSALGAEWLAGLGIRVPEILVLTTLALVVAQTGIGRHLRGARVMGLFTVYVFLAVIGALCDLESVMNLGRVAADLTILVVIVFAVHGVLIFAAARVLKIDPATASVASQAGIGGGSSALALARSLDRHDLVLPGILAGSLGTAIGTYMGFAVAGLLG
jgi:uncharacterized membrane protein